MAKRILLFILLGWSSVFHVPAQEAAEPIDMDAFWEALCAVNQNYVKYQADSSKFKIKCQAEFFQMTAKGMRDLGTLQHIMNPNEQQLLEIVNPLLVGKRNRLYQLIIINDPDPNAFVLPDGSVYVHHSLLQMLDTEEILGVLAHEIAHHKLKHAEIEYYAQQRKERRNEIWAGIFAGLSTTAYSIGQGLSGQEVDKQVVNNIAHASLGIAAENAENWGLRYSRMQELEADMAAANVLDYLEIGRAHLINAYRKYQTYSRLHGDDGETLPKRKRKKNTHPTWSERIALLETYQTMNDYLDKKIRKQTEKQQKKQQRQQRGAEFSLSD